MADTAQAPAAQAVATVPVVEAAGITKRFGATVALRDARIAIHSGESHALVGRNGAGKSTLVSILTGMQQPDSGTLSFSGEPAPAFGDTAAWRTRVACVYQRSTMIGELTVAENLYLNRYSLNRQSEHGLRPIRWKALRARAGVLLAEYGVDVSPTARLADLTVEQRQFVEIARALSFGARFIILDEPTAKLDARGIERLFTKLRGLQEQGVAFLFISHHLQEVYELCTRVTVYRDARHILTAPVAGLGHDALVEAMTGEGTAPAAPAIGPVAGNGTRTGGAQPVLTLRGLTLPGVCTDLSLTVHPGEVVGLAGATASGNVQIGETVAGLHRPRSGEMTVAGRGVRLGDIPAALAAGIGFVPEDRHLQGLVPDRSVAENATLTVTDQLGPYGTVLPSRTRSFARRMIEDLDIKTPDAATPVSALSGGNQQKVVVARALATEPELVVAIRPTNGVDIKSKEFLLGRFRRHAEEGHAALIVSDELDDLRTCDRVIAVFHGRVAAEFPAGWTDEQLVAAMEGVARTEPESGPGSEPESEPRTGSRPSVPPSAPTETEHDTKGPRHGGHH